MTSTSAEAPGTRPGPGDTFHVRAEPGGGWWGLTIDELATVFAQTKHFEDIEAEARSAIAFWFDVDESQIGDVIVLVAPVPSDAVGL